MEFLIILLFIHFVFDYILQPRRIADTKWDNIGALSTHVAIYTIGLTIAGATIPFIYSHYDITTSQLLMFVTMNAVAHWLIDFFTSKASHMYYGRKNWKAFFIVLGLDQFLHATTFLLVLGYVFHAVIIISR